VEGVRGGCGYEEAGCGWVGGGSAVPWGKRVSYGRSLVCVWAKYLDFLLYRFPANPANTRLKNEKEDKIQKRESIPKILKATRSCLRENTGKKEFKQNKTKADWVGGGGVVVWDGKREGSLVGGSADGSKSVCRKLISCQFYKNRLKNIEENKNK